jgi:hypothetical protein
MRAVSDSPVVVFDLDGTLMPELWRPTFSIPTI